MPNLDSDPATLLLAFTMEQCNECLHCGNFDKAHRALSRGLDLVPTDPVILSQRGRVALARKDFDGARADFVAALASDGDCAIAHSGLALCHLAGGREAEAEAAADRALALDPADRDATRVKAKIQSVRQQENRIVLRPTPAVRLVICVPEFTGDVAKVIAERLRDPFPRFELVCLVEPSDPRPALQQHFKNEARVSFRHLPAERNEHAMAAFIQQLSTGARLLWQSGDLRKIYEGLADPRPRSIEPEDAVDYYVDNGAAAAAPAAPPEYLLIALTNRCHYRCFFCCAETHRADRLLRDVPIEKFYSLQSAIETAGVVDLTSPGEVLLYPHVREAMQFVATHNRRKGFQFTTTGALLTEELIAPVASRIDQLTISINASNAATYERDLGAKMWDRVMANIRTMRKYLGRDHITLSFVAHGKNIEELPDLVKLAAELDVWHVRIAPFFVTKPEYVGRSLWFCKEKTKDIIAEARAIGQKRGVIVSNIHESAQQMSAASGHACMMPTWGTQIDRRGNVGACCYSEPHVMGNVYQGESFEQVWNGKKYRALRERLYFRHCQECPNIQPDMSRLDRHIATEVLAKARTQLPLFSVVIQAPATVEQVKAAVAGLKKQTYSIWEAIFSLDESCAPAVLNAVLDESRTDTRVRCLPAGSEAARELEKTFLKRAATGLLCCLDPAHPFAAGHLETLLATIVRFNPIALDPSPAAPVPVAPPKFEGFNLPPLPAHPLPAQARAPATPPCASAVKTTQTASSYPSQEAPAAEFMPGRHLLEMFRIPNRSVYDVVWQSRFQPMLRDQEALVPAGNGAKPFKLVGYCKVCGKERDLTTDFLFAAPPDASGRSLPAWRERQICSCQLNCRQRSAFHILTEAFGLNRDSLVYCTEQTTELFRRIRQVYPQATGSEYLGGQVPLGATNGAGLRNEDVTRLTYPDASFDCIFSLDVMEHVPNYSAGFQEMGRCLKPGGKLLLTAPFHFGLDRTVVRASVNEDGSLTHHLPPVYHGDPINAKGVLCFNDFGWDLLDELRAAGFGDATLFIFTAPFYGYIGFQYMFFGTRGSAQNAGGFQFSSSPEVPAARPAPPAPVYSNSPVELRDEAAALVQAGKWEQADLLYRQLIRLCPDETAGWEGRIACAVKQNHHTLGKLIRNDALMQHPEWAGRLPEPDGPCAEACANGSH